MQIFNHDHSDKNSKNYIVIKVSFVSSAEHTIILQFQTFVNFRLWYNQNKYFLSCKSLLDLPHIPGYSLPWVLVLECRPRKLSQEKQFVTLPEQWATFLSLQGLNVTGHL